MRRLPGDCEVMPRQSPHLRAPTHTRRATVDPEAEARAAAVATSQDGVISRAQAVDAGLTATMVRRKVRRREWVHVYDGIYVNHTGQLTWRQRAWAAVLDAAPAALADVSVLDCGLGGTIHIAVATNRPVSKRAGVVVHRRTRFTEAVQWDLRSPRLSVEEAALDVAARATTTREAIATLTRVVSDRRFNVDTYDMLAAITRRRRLRRRKLLTAVLNDVATGSCSVLEQGYLTDVERAHGLPTATRQAPTEVGRRGFRDNEYPEFGVIVELDGRNWHDDAKSRDKDLERDLDAATIGRQTIRLGYGQVFDRACSTAVKVGKILTAHGWPGHLVSCPRCAPNSRGPVQTRSASD